ncbi:isopenicillin-N epimerase [Diaminobutyricimonas aerilata]|uniref:Isopenicillin-N epimerase n=2 Tax=Diaminobutyricimonas aerilata TaxID=1162967 RepID=A0A2M9CFY2_9MICO|nr:isopenicillin-N epimerase [Diaminobutyricimonas aerilata]
MVDGTGRPAMALWTLDPSTIHLNHGSFGAVPVETAAYQAELGREMNGIPGDWFSALPGRLGAARERAAEFLRVAPESAAFVINASAGISVVLQSLELRPGAEILVTDHSYGAVTMAAQRAVRRVGGVVREVPVPLDAADDEVVDILTSAFTDGTALLIVDQITSATARVFPIAAIAARSHERGVPVLVDAAHAPAMLPEPLAGSTADYWVGNLHKWGCTPRGAAVLVASDAVAQSLYPSIDSWGHPHPYPTRFDTQGTVDATAQLAAPHALDLIEREFGWDAARSYMTRLVEYAETLIVDALEQAWDGPARVAAASPAPAMRLVGLPDGLVRTPTDAHELRDVLALDLGFQTAITSWNGTGYLRLSAHVYNTADDYRAFADTAVPVIAELAHIRSTEPDLTLDETIAQHRTARTATA